MSEKKKENEMKLEIHLDEETAQGVYANLVMVNHSDTEFTLDFIFVQPQAPRAKVRSRIITSPRHVRRLIEALEDNLRHYEERLGATEASQEKAAPETGEYH